jgi:hypothetical protein
LAELLPLPWAMRANLQLVKPLRVREEEAREEREICFRFPADEPVWEVSCNGLKEKSRPAPALRSTRRAS